MSKKSRARRRKLLKYGALAAGTLAAAYFGTNLFSGGSGEKPADSGSAGETPETQTGDSAPVSAPTMAGLGGISPTLLLIGAGIVLLLVMKKK